MTDNIIAGPGSRNSPEPETSEPNTGVVAFLEDLLEEARAGDVQGVALASIDSERIGSYAIVGRVGGYSMQGAADCVVRELAEINMSNAER